MPWWIWTSFIVMVTLFIAIDLGAMNRKAHVIGMREAVGWTSMWVSLALLFNVFVYFLYDGNLFPGHIQTAGLSGSEAALQFLTAYVVEESLSFDNMFVIAIIISTFRVPPEHQHRLLFWGILVAVVLRGVMIALGATLLDRFEWITYVFGGLLLVSAARMMTMHDDEFDPNHSLMLKLARRMYPVTTKFNGRHFFAEENGRRVATPMFLALMLIEGCDVMFAIDSIPAVFAVTRDPFLVFTSNIFAILGLRSLYFVLSGMMDRFHYLKMSLVFLLAYVGMKMLLTHHFPIPNYVSLLMIVGILGVGVLASLMSPPKPVKLHTAETPGPAGDDLPTERFIADDD